MTFETWKHGGRRYLAAQTGNGTVQVVDDIGGNYGAWMDTESFRTRQRKGEVAQVGCYEKLRVVLY